MAKEPVVKKPRKRRKPMSEEQRKAAAERLAAAREKRMKENPPQYKSVHPEVVALGDDHPLAMKNVRGWIKSAQERVGPLKKAARMNEKGALAKATALQGYIANMERYLRDGVWCDLFYGEFQQNRIKQRCIAPAYYANGVQKRSHGVYYDDIRQEWDSLTMKEEDF